MVTKTTRWVADVLADLLLIIGWNGEGDGICWISITIVFVSPWNQTNDTFISWLSGIEADRSIPMIRTIHFYPDMLSRLIQRIGY